MELGLDAAQRRAPPGARPRALRASKLATPLGSAPMRKSDTMNSIQQSTARAPARIFLVDDHPLVCEGLAAIISRHADLCVCGTAASEDEALGAIGSLRPDLAIVDIGLKQGDGISLVKQIDARFPDVKTLVVSIYDESLYAERALRAGAAGYLCKREAAERTIDAIRHVLAGEIYLNESARSWMLKSAIGHRGAADQDPLQRLSDRELEVFLLIGQGLKSSQIGERLHLSVHTIDTYREKIKSKLNLQSGAELHRRAVQWALEHGH
jgi:DNA-binding NarL/FixJ family response regulator